MIKEILKAWTKEVDDENVVKAFLPKVIYLGDAG